MSSGGEDDGVVGMTFLESDAKDDSGAFSSEGWEKDMSYVFPFVL